MVGYWTAANDPKRPFIIMSTDMVFIALLMKWAEDEAHAEIIEESLHMASGFTCKTVTQLSILSFTPDSFISTSVGAEVQPY